MSTSRFRHSSATAAQAYLALSCIGLATSAAPALAQDSTEAAPARLGGMTVSDTAIDDDGYKVDTLSSPKATAPLIDTPRSITVISSRLLSDTNSTSLAEALRTVPGITMGAGEGGNALGDRPFIRGSDSQASTYLDGVRDIAAQSRETFAVEAIEVTKGSDSVTNGSGNAGGSINLVSKAPKADRFAHLDASYGNDDYKRVTVDVNQPLNDFIGVRINGMWHDQDVAGRDAVWQKRWGVAPSIKFGLNGPTSLQLDWYHLHTSELPDTGIPYLTTISNQPGANDQTAPAGTSVRSRDAYYGLADRDFRKTTVDQFTARFQHEFDNGLTLRNTARFSDSSQKYLWTQPDDSKGNVYSYGTVSRRVNSRYSKQQGLVDQLDLSGTFATGVLEHSFTAALEYSWQKSGYGSYYADSTSYTALPTAVTCATATSGSNAICTDLANPNPYDSWTGSIVKGPANSRTLASSETYSASLFDTISLGEHWKLNIGGRYDHYDTDASAAVAKPFTAARTWQHRTDDLFTYQAGLVFKPVSNGTIYVSTATSAIPPGSFLAQGSEDNGLTTAGVSTDDLKVAKTTSYEAGTKWNLFGEALALSFDVFQTRTTNSRTTNPDGGVLNVGTKRIRGFELGFSGNITPEWNVFGGYTYMDSKVLNAGLTATTGTDASGAAAKYYAPAAATGHAFPNTPKNSFTLFTNYKVTPQLTLGGGAIYMDKVYGGFSDTRTYTNGVFTIVKTRATYVPSYWRFDANASYDITDNIAVRVNALNITNKLYYDQAYSTHYAHQAAGRTVIGTVSFKY
ncbi:TonB-dependent siderophore receptor [Novosphingobium sp. KA1]|uniref:TonB-dependent receptor n=1 Tax=Novosphingobium sp. (strain KA1) TaxID=164608 RepID=UPI001A900A5A|nr:TonB-dependent receptor [Novosphingobium sp. KA1]